MDIARKPRTTRRKAAVGLVLAAIAVVGTSATLWRSSPAAAASVERSAVWTERVRRGDLVIEVPVQGTLVPEHVQWLSAETAARVARIAVRPGAEVEADTVVLVLENTDLELAALESERLAASAQAALIQLDVRTLAEQKSQEGSLLALRAELADAEQHAAAAERLAPEGLVRDLDRRSARNRLEGLRRRDEVEASKGEVIATGRARQLAAQRAEVERLREIATVRRRQLAALEVRAAIRGVVQEIPLENGQWVATGTVLAKIAEPDRLKADVRVPQSNAKDVRKGLAVRFDGPAGAFRGRIARVDPAVVAGSVRLEVSLDGDLPPDARADQAVTGHVEIDKLGDVLFVARPSGVRDESLGEIFRLDPDRLHAARVTARFGRGSARDLEITGGLGEGDEIVVSDTSTWDASHRVRFR